jgi:hypothetical protein
MYQVHESGETRRVSCLQDAYSLGEQNSVTGRPAGPQSGSTVIPDVLKSDSGPVTCMGTGTQQV